MPQSFATAGSMGNVAVMLIGAVVVGRAGLHVSQFDDVIAKRTGLGEAHTVRGAA